MAKTRSFQICLRGNGLARLLLVLLILAGFVLAACSETSNAACPEETDPFVKYELFMGRSTADGDVVVDDEWDIFLADTVTPRFPDGLTVLDAQGQWRNSEGRILKERSTILVILAPPGEDARRLINEISDEYQVRFNQESVLQVVGETCVSFS